MIENEEVIEECFEIISNAKVFKIPFLMQIFSA